VEAAADLALAQHGGQALVAEREAPQREARRVEPERPTQPHSREAWSRAHHDGEQPGRAARRLEAVRLEERRREQHVGVGRVEQEPVGLRAGVAAAEEGVGRERGERRRGHLAVSHAPRIADRPAGRIEDPVPVLDLDVQALFGARRPLGLEGEQRLIEQRRGAGVEPPASAALPGDHPHAPQRHRRPAHREVERHLAGGRHGDELRARGAEADAAGEHAVGPRAGRREAVGAVGA
jgi:hypothetical protein